MGAVCYEDYLKNEPLQDLMNPCKSASRETMTALLRVFAAVFEDRRFHMGGDEVLYSCWGQDKSVQPGCAFTAGGTPIANETTYNQLEARFEKLLHRELAAGGGKNSKLPMHWHDPITERGIEYPRSTLIEVWDGTNRSVLPAILALGYPAVYAGCASAATTHRLFPPP